MNVPGFSHASAVAGALCLAAVSSSFALNCFAQVAAAGPAAPIAATASTSVPALVAYSGAVANENKLAGEATIAFLIFKEEAGGEPLFAESQTVAIDPAGRYKVQLGATRPNGIPLEVFAAGEARWLEVQVAGEKPAPRTLLASVPYALKAADAATLGGLPASAFVLAGARAHAGIATAAAAAADSPASAAVTSAGGKTGAVPVFTGADTLGNSLLFQNSAGTGMGIGINPNPSAILDIDGKTIVRGIFNLSRTGDATPEAGANSYPEVFNAMAYDSGSQAAVSPVFSLQAEVTGNNTASPGATFNLLYDDNSGPGAETGLFFNPNGTIHFAPGQTFPGTGSITGVTAGAGLVGGGDSGNITLSLDETRFPVLTGTNIFVGNQAVTGNFTASGTITTQGSATFDASGAASVAVSASGNANGVVARASSAATYSAAVSGYESAPSGIVYGVNGSTDSATFAAAGVNGFEGATTGAVYGVAGATNSTSNFAAGVNGYEGAATGQVFGVSGRTSSSTNGATGVSGGENAVTGQVYGVQGYANSVTNGASGVNGNESASSGQVYGVFGSASSATNFAAGVSGFENAVDGQVFGVAGGTASMTNFAAGVSGNQTATKGQVYGVVGGASSTTNGAAGVSGSEHANTGQVYGVTGYTSSATNGAAGVSGGEGAATGVVYGVVGNTASTDGVGVFGFAGSTTGAPVGVQGFTSSTTAGFGVLGATSATSGQSAGVRGTAPDTSGSNFGVQGIAGKNGVGVQGTSPHVALAASNQACSPAGCAFVPGTAGQFVTGEGGLVLQGSLGTASGATTEVFHVDSGGNGYFAGNLHVTGNVSKGGGSFKIDHPLDPANKFLSHSFVESPDMMDVYNGNITTDKLGRATVVLPEYFQALNRDFRYQLTVIGEFAQAIVAREIDGNRFVIRTSKPGVKVSWQVTGIRQDAYANSNRIPVEEDKDAGERGRYLHPEAFGQPPDKSVTATVKPPVVRGGAN